MRVALIQCTSRKKAYQCPARELYSESPRFRLAYDLAKLTADEIYILSARYGLVAEDTMIEPYDETLNHKNVRERHAWGSRVVTELQKIADLEKDEFIVIAGKNYRDNLLPHLVLHWVPLKGKRQGEWIPELKRLIMLEKECDHVTGLHMLFNGLPRLDWESLTEIPYRNGIYIMFEKGETYHGLDRIVRIGTHRGQERLVRRLKDHFLRENAGGSILRKNIGRAFLGKAADPYLRIWNISWRNDANTAQYRHLRDREFEAGLESRISDYLRSNFSFVCIPVSSARERLRLEEGLIALLHRHPSFGPGADWFGLNSPISDIAESGLWNRQGLHGDPLTELEFERVKWLARFGGPQGNITVDTSGRRGIKVKQVGPGRVKPVEPVKRTADDIRRYLEDLFGEEKAKGRDFVELVSGDIHRQLGMKNRMPQVCQIMYEKMQTGDEILHTTPSGKSSTIKIRYRLRGRQ